MTQRIYRHEVPVDGQWHEFDMFGPVLGVDCRNPSVVEFWGWHFEGGPGFITTRTRLIVVGTGHAVPIEAGRYIGHAVAPGGSLVWHLLGES